MVIFNVVVGLLVIKILGLYIIVIVIIIFWRCFLLRLKGYLWYLFFVWGMFMRFNL